MPGLAPPETVKNRRSTGVWPEFAGCLWAAAPCPLPAVPPAHPFPCTLSFRDAGGRRRQLTHCPRPSPPLLCADMPHAHGYRARTRSSFSLAFRKHGVINLSTYLKPVKVGDLVDIVANPAIHKGMPHKYYHGRTGTVFNVTPHAVGIEVNKQVRTRVIRKRLHVRIEHVRQSKCRKDFLDRVNRNDEIKRKAKEAGSTLRAP